MTASVRHFIRHYLEADVGTLLAIEHVVMLPSMLVAMLLRREEYSHGTHRHRVLSSAATV